MIIEACSAAPSPADQLDITTSTCIILKIIIYSYPPSISGIVVSIAAFQAVDPGSIPG